MDTIGQLTSLRNERKACHFWVDNEVVDNYQAIVGADAVWIYCRIARYAHGAWIVSPKVRGAVDTRVGLREMAEWCGKSTDTVWRCLQVLEHVGLIRSEGGARSRGRYALADVKDLVLREGGAYDTASGSVKLPARRVEELAAEVRSLRSRLARKTTPAGGLSIAESARAAVASVAQSDSFAGGLFVVPADECDRTVAPLCDSSVAHRATDDLLLEESKKARLKDTPQPPFANANGGDGESAPDADRLDAETQRLMDAVGITARRARRKLRAVVAKRVELGEYADEAVDRMIAAYEKQARNSRLLFRVAAPIEFFETGLWLDMNRWNWDQQAVREERQRSEARVGSM